MVAKMPDPFWAFEDEGGGVPRSGFWIDEQSECPEGSPEYARVSPDTIPLPRAEVEALMEAAEAGLHRDNCPSVEFAGGQCDCGRDDVLAALATLQERMK